jgi:hypothetical protein
MKFKGFAILMVACLALGALSFDAAAQPVTPGQCLLFPYFNTTAGANFSVITVTNTGPTAQWVCMRFIDGDACLPVFTLWENLAPNDTYTFIDRAYFPPPGRRGLMYAYVCQDNGDLNEITTPYNNLVGQELVFTQWYGQWQPAIVSYGMNAVPFQGLAPDGNAQLLLNGTEYSVGPQTSIFPRFFGQIPGFFESFVLIVKLSGSGSQELLDLNTTIFNDSGLWQFAIRQLYDCWHFEGLTSFSGNAALDTWLASLPTSDPLELWDGNPVPTDYHKKTGWMSLTGLGTLNVNSQVYTAPASCLAVLIEGIGGNAAASLPFTIDTGTTGNLWIIP